MVYKLRVGGGSKTIWVTKPLQMGEKGPQAHVPHPTHTHTLRQSQMQHHKCAFSYGFKRTFLISVQLHNFFNMLRNNEWTKRFCFKKIAKK